MFRPPASALAVLLMAGATACERNAGSVSCGIDAFTGPLVVKESFAQGAALASPPYTAPQGLPVRLAAGPAWHATVARDSVGRWLVTAHGATRTTHVGYGVLVVNEDFHALGVLAFDASRVRGAAGIGTLAIGDTVVPLLGIRIDPARIQNAKCPVFPDSLR